MPPRHLWSFLACVILASRLAVAHDNNPLILPQLDPPNQLEMVSVEPSLWFEGFWTKSILRFFAPPLLASAEPSPEMPQIFLPEEPISVSPDCPVAPLSALQDADAMTLEAQVGTSLVVDVEGLTPTTAAALDRFQRIVTRVGGAFALTSAYRPSSYQEYLQEVWDKWVKELRRNRSQDCEALRAQVQEEFSSHQLLYSQRPAGASDHTLGIGVDASVKLPRVFRGKRRRISVDRLARQAGFSRPEPRRDPVHFRLIGGRV